MLDKIGLSGLPCGTPFRRLTKFPLIKIGARSHLRIRRKVSGHFIHIPEHTHPLIPVELGLLEQQ